MHRGLGTHISKADVGLAMSTWRIMQLRIRGWLRGLFPPFITRLTLLRGRKLTMVINHLLTGMILQVQGGQRKASYKWGDITLANGRK